MSIHDLSDEELASRYVEANEELARRRRLNEIPNEISELAQQWRDNGGEESEIVDAVTNLIGHPLEINEPQA